MNFRYILLTKNDYTDRRTQQSTQSATTLWAGSLQQVMNCYISVVNEINTYFTYEQQDTIHTQAKCW